MPYALVAEVSLDGFSREEAVRILHEQIIPIVKQQPGFQRGVWLRSQDGATGSGVVVFDTEANVEAMRALLTQNRPAEAPPITSSAVYEVTGEA
jgi:hypothetical protein